MKAVYRVAYIIENLGNIDLREWTFSILKIATYWPPKNMPISQMVEKTTTNKNVLKI